MHLCEKLVFEKGRVATTPFTEPIQVLFKIAKVLQGSENKKELALTLTLFSAPLATESCNWINDFQVKYILVF
ncbi:MAG TPA: hypothetical protein DCO75_01505 [Fibrobacteres bacterium]|nr:hypothetical protein [Fibrobacterota bacterium]